MSAEVDVSLKLDVKISGLGKINEAEIKLRPFTVIAGCNSSGKSFITRSLYSLLSSLLARGSYQSEVIQQLIELEKKISKFKKINASEEGNKFTQLEEQLKSLKNHDSLQLEPDSAFSSTVLSFSDTLRGLAECLDKPSQEELRSYLDLLDSSTAFMNYLNDVGFKTAGQDLFEKHLLDNFMVPSLRSLKRKNKKIFINLMNLGSVTYDEKLTSSFQSDVTLFGHRKPVYLESPVYWKLALALAHSQDSLHQTAEKRNLSRGELVNQTPQYFFDLMDMLGVQVKTTEFNDIAEKIEQIIGGNLSIDNGNIQFSEKEAAPVGLNLTALGVTNLGMIALLIRRGAIMKGTFLFIDEPEVHLHPAWQVVLVKVLHALAKRGVHVVIASHSIDIMKAIEVIMDEDESIDPQTHFGINQLTQDGYSVNESDNNYKRLAAIKSDLGKPFYDMMTNGLDF